MRFLVLTALLFLPQAEPKWIAIKEMSGPIPDHPGITVEVSAAEIKRGDKIKLALRMDFPWGAPYRLFKQSVPWGFDPSSISRIQGYIELDCATFTVKPSKESAEIYQFNGKKYKSKEPPFTLPSGHVFAQYFCEQGTAPTEAPKLKPVPK